MAIETFNKEQFEKALPDNAVLMGVIMGELCWFVPVTKLTGIMVRSSIPPRTGLSAEIGEDSIRCMLMGAGVMNAPDWHSALHGLGTKSQKYITRVSGWEKRLANVLQTLTTWINTAGDCPKCGLSKHFYTVHKTGPNNGRVFAKCARCEEGFTWIT